MEIRNDSDVEIQMHANLDIPAKNMENIKQPLKRILLIDDDPIANMISTKIISNNFNFSVLAYANAREALGMLEQWANSAPEIIPDLIFLDINMPQMDGWEFLEEFQKMKDYPEDKCQVIMLTSSLDRGDIERSKTYKCVKEFISKPLTAEKIKSLAAHVENFVV
jgi:CheY-like chemotaxis protein